MPDELNFNNEIEEYLITTPAHANEFNNRQQKLLDNDKYLNNKIDTTKTELSAKIDTENEKQNIKIDQLVAGGVNVSHTHIIEIDDWTLNNETNMYEVTIENPLLTERIVISTYNENGDTLVPDATVKDNNVIVRSTENNRTFVYLINGNAQTSLINATVDDNRVSEMTTYS
ncbi:TPA: hypothetical protein KNR82_004428, partial [Clostridioides difficile]|nr:hypothetical protein [Clostridioides difficile]